MGTSVRLHIYVYNSDQQCGYDDGKFKNVLFFYFNPISIQDNSFFSYLVFETHL